MYTTQHFETSISVPEYLERFVDVPTFHEVCKTCPNYDSLWTCPPYDFDVTEYWNRYQTLQLFATKIIFDEEYLSRTYTQEELDAILQQVLPVEKQHLSDRLFALEKQHPGSISLSSGSCNKCSSECRRPKDLPCCHPETMRYSIESLGGNVGLTVWKLFGVRLEWMEAGKLPHHFVLVSGLLLS